jgi:chromosome partitioning protein
MPIISVLNQKGGSGKTTIATNIAHALSLEGEKVLLVDSDPQGSARDWSEANEGELLPVVGLDRETLAKDLLRISEGYQWVIVDGAPQLARMAAAAVKVSDMVLIPVQPSPYDIWATADLVEIVKARQEVANGFPKAAFVISRAIKNTKLGKEVGNALSEYEIPILKSVITQLVVYPTTASKGLSVLNSADNTAITEIKSLLTEIKSFLIGDGNVED